LFFVEYERDCEGQEQVRIIKQIADLIIVL